MELLDGRYELLEELGRGAFGQVLRARDHRTEREVALKLLTHALDAEDLLRFQREGELTARLDHPHVLRVHGAGLHAERPYLVYELVPGARTLRELLDEGDLATRVARVQAVAAGLAHAHAEGVTHRDLKPENVLVDAQGRIRVADFGLATAEGLERLTQTGAVLGTPTHMAPEQVEGRREAIGPATDVWALGVLLYRTLCGRPPFPGTTFAALALQIVGDPPPPPSRHAPVPAALDALCLRALARDPEQRPPDAGAFAAELEAALAAPDRAAGSRWLVAALGVGALLALGIVLTRPAATETETTGTTLSALPEPQSPRPTPAETAASESPSPRSRDPVHAFPLRDPQYAAFLQGPTLRLLLASSQSGPRGGWRIMRREGSGWSVEDQKEWAVRSAAVKPDGQTFVLLERDAGRAWAFDSRYSSLVRGARRFAFPHTTEHLSIDRQAKRIAGGGHADALTLHSLDLTARGAWTQVVRTSRQSSVWALTFTDHRTLAVAMARAPDADERLVPSELLIAELGRDPRVFQRFQLRQKTSVLVAARDPRTQATWLACGGQNGEVRVFHRPPGGRWREAARYGDVRLNGGVILLTHAGRISGIVLDPANGRMFTTSAAKGGNDVAEWRLAIQGDEAPVRRFLDARLLYRGLALDPTGTWLLLGCERGAWSDKDTVELWRLRDARMIRRRTGLDRPQKPTKRPRPR